MRAGALVLLLVWSALASPAAAGGVTQPVEARGGTAPGPALEAPSALLMDALTGRVVYEKDARVRRYPASLTKLMTMYLVLRAVQQGQVTWEDDVVASERAAGMGGAQIYLQAGEVMKLRDLFKAVAVASANDAAVALAEHVAGSVEAFVAAMNETARQLGMQDTHFTNPHGLHDPDHYSTAYDIALLSRALLRDFPEVLQYTSIWIDYVREGERRFQLVNTNRMVAWYRGVDGLKTGFNDASGYGVSATMQEGDTRFIAVVMGHRDSRRRFAEAYQLLRFGFSRWEAVPVARPGDTLTSVRVFEGTADRVDLVAQEHWGVLVPKGGRGDLEREIVVKPAVTAPVRRGDVLGYLVVRRGEEELGRLELVAKSDVPRLGLPGLVLRALRWFWPLGR